MKGNVLIYENNHFHVVEICQCTSKASHFADRFWPYKEVDEEECGPMIEVVVCMKGPFFGGTTVHVTKLYTIMSVVLLKHHLFTVWRRLAL